MHSRVSSHDGEARPICKRRRAKAQWALSLAIALTWPAASQRPVEWREDLVDRLAGTWIVLGTVLGREAHHNVRAEWVLNHQFLRIQEKTATSAPADERPYDAIWFLGYDPIKARYILHLLDTFGGRYSETLGYGIREGNEIRFAFEYPDGPFRNTYRWNSRDGTWQWYMEQKDKGGVWAPFADLKLTRVERR